MGPGAQGVRTVKDSRGWGPSGPQGSDHEKPWNYIREFRLYVEANRESMIILEIQER